jgi:hypothetical protein
VVGYLCPRHSLHAAYLGWPAAFGQVVTAAIAKVGKPVVEMELPQQVEGQVVEVVMGVVAHYSLPLLLLHYCSQLLVFVL